MFCFMYAAKSAFDFLLCLIHSSHCACTNAPAHRVVEPSRMWGRRLVWFVNFRGMLLLFWSDGGKVGSFFVVEDKMKHTKRAILIFSKYWWNYNENLCPCPLRCSGKGRFGSRFCCEINSSELFCIEFQWVSEQFRFVKAALLGDFSASVFVESTSSALPSCMQE